MRPGSSRALVRPRYDETLYSMAARLSVYLGVPTAGDLHRAVFVGDMPVFDGALPAGIGRVVDAGVFGPADVAGAIREWTLFPYHAAFVEPARLAATERAMGGLGEWPQGALGGWPGSVPVPNVLRFCLECREDMLSRHADLWWRRSHQLPGVMMCPDHGTRLSRSSVDGARSSRYVAADLACCPTSAPPVVCRQEPRVERDLLTISQMSDALLDREPHGCLDDDRESYLRRLARLRLLNRRGEADLHGIALAMDRCWGSTMGMWSGLTRGGRCAEGWLGQMLWSGRASPPLHHVLLRGMLDSRLGCRDS